MQGGGYVGGKASPPSRLQPKLLHASRAYLEYGSALHALSVPHSAGCIFLPVCFSGSFSKVIYDYAILSIHIANA